MTRRRGVPALTPVVTGRLGGQDGTGAEILAELARRHAAAALRGSPGLRRHRPDGYAGLLPPQGRLVVWVHQERPLYPAFARSRMVGGKLRQAPGTETGLAEHLSLLVRQKLLQRVPDLAVGIMVVADRPGRHNLRHDLLTSSPVRPPRGNTATLVEAFGARRAQRHEDARTSSRAWRRRSACSCWNTRGGRILSTFPAGPVALSSMPRSRIASVTLRAFSAAGSRAWARIRGQ